MQRILVPTIPMPQLHDRIAVPGCGGTFIVVRVDDSGTMVDAVAIDGPGFVLDAPIRTVRLVGHWESRTV